MKAAGAVECDRGQALPAIDSTAPTAAGTRWPLPPVGPIRQGPVWSLIARDPAPTTLSASSVPSQADRLRYASAGTVPTFPGAERRARQVRRASVGGSFVGVRGKLARVMNLRLRRATSRMERVRSGHRHRGVVRRTCRHMPPPTRTRLSRASRSVEFRVPTGLAAYVADITTLERARDVRPKACTSTDGASVELRVRRGRVSTPSRLALEYSLHAG